MMKCGWITCASSTLFAGTSLFGVPQNLDVFSCLYKVSTLWWYVFWTWQTISNNSHIRAITGLFVEADVYQVEMHQTFILEMAMTWGSSFHFNFPRRSVHHLLKHICDQNDGCSVLVNGDTDTLHAWWNVYYLTTLHDSFLEMHENLWVNFWETAHCMIRQNA